MSMTNYISKKVYIIPAKSTITINFGGLTMNYFRVVNSGNASVYGGISHMPTKRLYDFRVMANQAKMYAEEKAYNHLYIYNDSTEETSCLVYAFNAKFEPTVLALCDALFNDTEEKAVNVEIGGFTESLPNGTNNIGKVTIANVADFTNKAAPGITYIKSGDNVASQVAHNFTYINFLSNDSENDMTVNIGGEAFTLKGNEVLENIRFETETVVTIPAGSSFRVMGV